MTGRVRRRGVRLGAPVAVVMAALTGCLDLSSDPSKAFSLELDSIPYPSLLATDTMRDTLGDAAPLRAVAYNTFGEAIPGAPISYFMLDTGAVIDPSGILSTTRRTGSLRVVASISGIQTAARTIIISRRPDSLFTDQDTLVEYVYRLPDVPANTTPELRVNVTTTDTIGGLAPAVHGWVVRWRAVHNGDTLAPSDTTLATLLNASGVRSAIDTTPADGASRRKLRIWANSLPDPVDSFVVVAEVKRHGVTVPGSPVLFLVKVAPPSVP